MARPKRRADKRLAARQASVPTSGYYKDANGRDQYMVKPGSQNRNK